MIDRDVVENFLLEKFGNTDDEQIELFQLAVKLFYDNKVNDEFTCIAVLERFVNVFDGIDEFVWSFLESTGVEEILENIKIPILGNFHWRYVDTEYIWKDLKLGGSYQDIKCPGDVNDKYWGMTFIYYLGE